ncbi:MAG: pyrroline-5-carboxylate reductase [Gammaproteobacteria bacterium]|jgi:pyrroline-5-carboxylate reductase|nr:pyrroline-5-carboxylate reductase [Gammaproteobacteria bacterium]
MDSYRIGFIGGGNMARSLVGGLIAGGIDATRISVAEPDASKRDELSTRFGITTSQDNGTVASDVEVLVLAVKPQVMRQVVTGLAATLHEPAPLLISIAAGVRAASMLRWLGQPLALVRAMPNTPALVRSGATALYASPEVSEEQRSRAESIMRAVGQTLWIDDEGLMDAVTALSGSGPAYFFLFMEALEQAAKELGLPPEAARLLTLETAQGAARMALSSDEGPALLRKRVTSPGGTTEAALGAFAEGGFETLVTRAVRAACERSAELAVRLDRDDG